jgi:hypothetical protein
MPRLTRDEKYEKIRQLYEAGWTYRQLMRQYRVSPNLIRKLTRDITIQCARCKKVKGPREKFELHHPDKQNKPDLTVPLCKPCHLAVTLEERAKLRESIRQGFPEGFGGPTPPHAERPTTVPAPAEGPPNATLPDWLVKLIVGGSLALCAWAVCKTLYDLWKESRPQVVRLGSARR